MDKQKIIAGMEQGDHRSLSKAITLAESSRPDKYEMALEILEHFGQVEGSFRIGITGTPGAGKSTLINVLGKELIDLNPNEKLAVLSIDPSSSVSGGSILGDKTRMADLSQRDDVFIRPTASGTYAGGLSRNTRLAMLMCEAAGFKQIIVETVGVGQGETEISQLTDMFVLLLSPGGGDELQGIKRGIVELADLLVVNKADGDSEESAKRTAKEYAMAQHLLPETDSGWKPKVLTCSALKNIRIDKLAEEILNYKKFAEGDVIKSTREAQAEFWLLKNLQAHLMKVFSSLNSEHKEQYDASALPERIALELSKKISL
ncbi:methylmalonyl Co-A mutase-associated GTPase MeaB [bacterium]|nr:methylmalonyl Co-A mutase-associated GTPase MeaB [bacterium]